VAGALAGSPAPAPAGFTSNPCVLAWSPASHAYGGVVVGSTSSNFSYTLRNTGGTCNPGPATISGGFSATDFHIVSDGCGSISLPAESGTCVVVVNFRPTAIGNRSALLSVTNANPGMVPASLTGTGTDPVRAVAFTPPEGLAFGSATINARTAPRHVTVTSTGNSSVTISAVRITGTNAADFPVVGETCTNATLAPNATCGIDVAFQPLAPGTRLANIELTDNAPGSPHTLPLSGIGEGPVVVVEPMSVDFETRQDVVRTVTVRNVGGAPLTITAVALSGANPEDFEVVGNGCSGRTIAPQGTCTVGVVFHATRALATHTARLGIADNAAGSPHGVDLRASDPLPAPVVGRSANLYPAEGRVMVLLPGSRHYIRLEDARQVRTGTIVDARRGKVELCSASDRNGHEQCGIFYAGKFKVLQATANHPTTELRLVGGSFASCSRSAKATGQAAAKRKSRRRVWGNAKGRFRIRGRYASATVRGTVWRVADFCDGTGVRVNEGRVTVRDLVRHRNLIVRAGHSRFVHS
jgi:hypothetical protein